MRSCLPGKSVCRFATSPILLGNFLPQLQFRGFPASLVFTTNPLFPPLQLIARFVSLFSHFRVNSFTLLSRNNNTNSAISGENLGHKSTRNLGTNQREIWARNQREIWAQINGVRPTGSDRLTSGARAAISETTKRPVSTTNDRFVCRRFLAGEITGSFLCHASSFSAI